MCEIAKFIKFSFEIIIHCQIKFSRDINARLVLVLGYWELRTFIRAFVSLFGVAGEPSLIMLLCHRDFHVDLGRSFSLCFLTLSVDGFFVYQVLLSCISNVFLFVFNFCLSVSSPEVSAKCNFLFEPCAICFF